MNQIEREERQREARIELAVLEEANAAANQKKVQQTPRSMAAAAVDVAAIFPPNLSRQDVRTQLAGQGIAAGRE